LHARSVKVVFMGSPDFAVPALEAVHRSNQFEVRLVITQPDKPRGRGRNLSPTPVRNAAQSLGIPVLIKTKENYAEIYSEISALAPDFIVVAAFGMILKKDLLELPKRACVNLHASLLPKYRGVSPVPAALLSGDTVTGCTTMLMDEGIDTGDILLAERIDISGDDTAGSLSKKLALTGAGLLVKTLEGLLAGTIRAKKQDHDLATHTRKLKKNNGLIDWTKDARYIERFVRAMNPWPTAFTFYKGKRLIILKAQPGLTSRTSPLPGMICSLDPLTVECGIGALDIVELKVQGKKALSAAAFVSGYRVKAGDIFGTQGRDEESKHDN
jgi:methionyl-tRNA formyltransferase